MGKHKRSLKGGPREHADGETTWRKGSQVEVEWAYGAARHSGDGSFPHLDIRRPLGIEAGSGSRLGQLLTCCHVAVMEP